MSRTSLALPALSAILLILSISEIFRLFVSTADSNTVSRVAFLALGLAFIPFFTLREWGMTALATALSVGLWLTGDRDAMLEALDRAAFFAAFIYLVTLLKEAAARSRSVLELGSYLTMQPQGRRYYSLALGGHGMGVLLNFGAISLLVPLIQRGARAMSANRSPGDPTEAEREQQQTSALLRGFPWMILWSPTALTQAVLFTSVPEARASVVIPLGIGASVIMILIGRALDRFEWRHQTRSDSRAAPPFPKTASKRFAAICTVLIGATFAVVLMAGVSAAISLMLVAPLVMLLWVFAQERRADNGMRAVQLRATLRDVFTGPIRHSAQSAYVLGIAGFIGVTAAALAPVDLLANTLGEHDIAPWVFLSALPILITIGGQLGLSPIMVVVFLSAVINELPDVPADPSLIVFALGAGWALSMTASPNASATLLIASITKVPPTTLTWRWNGLYAALCFLAFVGLFVLLAR